MSRDILFLRNWLLFQSFGLLFVAVAVEVANDRVAGLLNSTPITCTTSTTRMRTLTSLPNSIELILSRLLPLIIVLLLVKLIWEELERT